MHTLPTNELTVVIFIQLISQDNYTFAQPGIQMKVNALRELIQRIDGEYMTLCLTKD